MAQLLRALRIAAVPHGFRSSLGDCASEETDPPSEVAEEALAHNVGRPITAGFVLAPHVAQQRFIRRDPSRVSEDRDPAETSGSPHADAV